ncbi:bifunctional hydroxymethylpyrimidine kinase/phosphomethylpyrimidine kinase [Methanococcoides alaskense]|uniref:Hydroxymethylpyrimidine/phosphomethylpyrimidine kinase n=2 Tax=Methanococcoides alaskense TaxID=325778 RepID=A0AA90ZCE3_9EURY|nr:bifunctional hydroxymethylpyrimidine kinase/phosphomethylpyrimidine kinase [Methanococcoides alaskense]MDR6222563.1 hydroxymethylpyrimidine/phosphomethylpyrimidine kinase [Methanococcoides alaskense]
MIREGLKMDEMGIIPVVLTIAGSDSGGGAGIEADIKTLSSLYVHGACAITSVTSQNTTGVQSAYGVPPTVVSDQMDAVCTDMDVRWAKTGMLSSADIVRAVADRVKMYGLKIVVDPVMAAEAGGVLLEQDAVSILKDELLPISYAVTPNIIEAEILSGMSITTREDAMEAAKAIASLGLKAVIITGGHSDGVDLVYDSVTDEFTEVSGKLIEGGTHGSGCTYSSALTAYLARGYSLQDAAIGAKEFVEYGILLSKNIGKGVGPVNQMGYLHTMAAKESVLRNAEEAVRMLEDDVNFASLVAEVGCNIAMAIPHAREVKDVAAVNGRIVKLQGKPKVVGCVSMGASSHVARIVLAAMEFDPSMRAAVNIYYSKNVLAICEDMGLTISSFSRQEEPEDTHTMDWGVTYAIDSYGRVPVIIYDEGGVGKEPMVRVLGRDAVEVAGIALEIAARLTKEQA